VAQSLTGGRWLMPLPYRSMISMANSGQFERAR
jgi:hypothetical protein